MQRKFLIAGNWKMHGSRAMVHDLLTTFKNHSSANLQAELVVFPPTIFLEQTQNLLAGSHISWGAQNVASELSGAFTGEISANMLLEFGCNYVLIGHSERRHIYGETDALLAKKFAKAKQVGLKPILCVGETLEERQQGRMQDVVLKQLNAILAAGIDQLHNAVLAYEPVWAIGTGITATPEQAQEVHAILRQAVAEHSQEIAQKLPILYGGSVKAANAKALFSMPDIDGGLIGGASLVADEFLQIYKLALPENLCSGI